MTLPILLRNLAATARYARHQREQQQSRRRAADVDRESVRNGERAVAEAVTGEEGQGVTP